MVSLRIDQVNLHLVSMPLVRTFETSSSRRDRIDHILVEVHADGLVGWGESATPSDPYYCEETSETAWHLLTAFLVPSVLGRRWSDPNELRAMYGKVKRNNFARAGLEMAAWDLYARALGQPLHALLGGTRQEILSGVSLGIEQDTARLFALIDQYVDEGYRRVKLKIAPGRDVEVIRRVRERYPALPLMADANSAYRVEDLPTLKALDRFELTMIEQPLAHDDIVDHARLQAELQTPICLDESIVSAADARKAIELGSCRVVNVKVSRLGGLIEATRTHDECAARGVPVWCGGMHEFGIGRAANVAFCSLSNVSIPGDVSGSDKYYAEDIVDPPIIARGGAIAVPTGPGLGVTPNRQRIASHTIRNAELSADMAAR